MPGANSTGSFLATPSASPRSSPPEPSATPSIEPTKLPPSATPISLQDLIALQDITSFDGGCIPPCWNGLTPGRSTELDIAGFVSSLGSKSVEQNTASLPGQLSSVSIDLADLNDPRILVSPIDVAWDQTAVRWISLYYFVELPKFLEPRALVDALGRPDQVLLVATGTDGPPPFALTLVFSEYGTAVSINGWASIAPEIAICPENLRDSYTLVWMFDEGSKPYLHSPVDLGELKDPSFYTGLGSHDFVDALMRDDKCIPLNLR